MYQKPLYVSSQTRVIEALSTHLPPGAMEGIIAAQERTEEQVKKAMAPCLSDIFGSSVPRIYDAGGQTRAGAIDTVLQSRYSNRGVEAMLLGLDQKYKSPYNSQEPKPQLTYCGGCPTIH